MKKFLSVMLCMLMLSAMAIPAMAEGEVTINKLDYTTLEKDFEDFTSIEGVTITNESGNSVLKTQNAASGKTDGLISIGENTNPITESVYEAGFKIKLMNAGSKVRTFTMQMCGSNHNYPRLNIKFTSSDTTGKWTLHENKNSELISSDVIIQEEWNDFRFKIVEDSENSKTVIDVYMNGAFIKTVESTLNGAISSNKNRYAYRWIGYNTNSVIETPIYIDDVYVAKHSPVTIFTQEAVNASVAVGEDAVLPSTVNVTADGVTETVNVLWGDVDTTTAGTKTVYGVMDGYSVDVKAVATVTVEAPQEPKYPYEAAIDGTTLTVTKAGTLTPEAKVYGAVYENGLLKDVQILGTVSGSTEWADGKTTLPLDEGKVYRAFVVDDQLVPCAISTTLN